MANEDALNELMESPLSAEPGRRTRWIILLVLAMAIIVAVIVAGGGDEGTTIDATSATDSTATSTQITTTTVPQLVLVDHAPEPALLYHPTVLPLGWEKCRQLEDISRGDRFCDPDQEDLWIQIAVKDAGTVRVENAVPIPDAHGAMWLSQADPVEIAVPTGTFSQIVALGRGVDGDDLLAVVDSIPLVSDRQSLYGDYELPLAMAALTEEQLAELVAAVDDNPRVVGQGDAQGDVQVFADTVTLWAFPNDAGGTLPDFVSTISMPRLLDAGRPVVVGERPSRGRTFAIWDQRAFSWRLEGQLPIDDMESLALEVIDKILAFE